MPYTPQTWTNGVSQLSAARFNHMEAGIDQAHDLGSTFISVKSFGAVGDGVADDAAEIQAAINSAGSGDTVWFPRGTYLVSQTIVFPGNITLLGGGGIATGTTIKAAAGIENAVLASAAWYNNQTTCGNPVRIQGIQIDGANVGTNVHGLVALNFWARYEDLQIRNTTGHGILLDDRTRNATNIITNSCSEPTIEQCRFDNTAGDGVRQESNNQIANLDGRIIGCFFATIGGHAVNLNRAAGWAVETNHYYGIGGDAIRLNSAYATVIRGNYIEDFGTNDVLGQFYNGITFSTILNTRASICADNTVSTQQPSSPTASRFACYNFRAGSGQLKAMVTVVGNTAMFADSTEPAVKLSQAFRFGEGGDSGRLLQVQWSGNQIENSPWWQRTRVVNAAVEFRGTNPGVVTLTDGATVPLIAPLGEIFKLSANGNRTILAPTDPVDGQRIFIAHTAVGASRTLSLTTGSANSFAFGSTITGLTATPQDTTDYIQALYDATAARWRVVGYVKGY